MAHAGSSAPLGLPGSLYAGIRGSRALHHAVGEGIIEEMYVFEDKGGRRLALRPEITAAVIRMYINEAKVAPKPLRWCYFADCFRYERPQKGRYRQFWQFGVELDRGRYGAGRCRGDHACSRHAQRYGS